MSKSSPATNELVKIGEIVAAHGIKGAVLILPFSQVLERLKPKSKISSDTSEFTISSIRPHKTNMMVFFQGVTTRNQSESLIGTALFTQAGEMELPADEYLVTDLIGLSVKDQRFGDIGTVKEVLAVPGGDILEVGTILIPFRSEFVLNVDINRSLIEVKLLDGMIEEPL